MASLRYSVGLDYHWQTIRVCVLGPDGSVLRNKECGNDVEAIVGVVADSLRGQAEGEVWVGIQSSCGAADLAEKLRQRTNWQVHLGHPGYIARMRQNPDKTDMHDAHLLADLVRVNYLPRVWLAPLEIRELRMLVRYRQDLARQRRAVKLQIRALLREQRISTYLRPWTKGWLEWVATEAPLSEQGRWLMAQRLQQLRESQAKLAAAEKRLADVTSSDPEVARLQEYKGIGRVTSWTLRAEIGRFDRFSSGKQLSRFCGLSPRNASSGQRQADAGLVQAANRELRTVLIEAAHRLIRNDAHWSGFATRLLERGKPKSVVVAAVANRWARRLYQEMKEPLPSAA